jgi:hypothetical protein
MRASVICQSTGDWREGTKQSPAFAFRHSSHSWWRKCFYKKVGTDVTRRHHFLPCDDWENSSLPVEEPARWGCDGNITVWGGRLCLP